MRLALSAAWPQHSKTSRGSLLLLLLALAVCSVHFGLTFSVSGFSHTPPVYGGKKHLGREAATRRRLSKQLATRYRLEAKMIHSESPSTLVRRAPHQAWGASETSSDDTRQVIDERSLDVRLTTFNLLAPCYKRMQPDALRTGTRTLSTGILAAQAKSSRGRGRESEFAEVWRHRAMQTVDFIRREMASSDIICLQEFWFDPDYEKIFEAALGDAYEFHTVRRTGGKADGVAVLLRRGKWTVRSSLGLSLSMIGDRIALLMHLQTAQEEEGRTDEDLVLVNTHLTFPHQPLDRANQMAQITSVTNTLEAFIGEAGLPPMTPRVVVGDLNVEESDPVCRHLASKGFRSAFTSLHRERRVITHLTHRGEEVMVDHVFVKAPGFAGRRRGATSLEAYVVPGVVARMHEDVSVEEALLLPGSDDAEAWCSRFSLSDHRPLTVKLKFPAY